MSLMMQILKRSNRMLTWQWTLTCRESRLWNIVLTTLSSIREWVRFSPHSHLLVGKNRRSCQLFDCSTVWLWRHCHSCHVFLSFFVVLSSTTNTPWWPFSLFLIKNTLRMWLQCRLIKEKCSSLSTEEECTKFLDLLDKREQVTTDFNPLSNVKGRGQSLLLFLLSLLS